jgi:Putative DNA-binding domain
MSTLEDLQRQFGRFLLEGDDRFEDAVVSTVTLDARSRLQIYANAYRTRFTEALSADFPMLRTFIGDDAFIDLSGAYIVAFPSKSFTLRGFGARLPEFIESQASLPERAFAAELAAFERALVEAFDAKDQSPMGIADMAAIAPEKWPLLEIDVHPSMRRVRTRFNTPIVWNALKLQQNNPVVAELTDSVACVVWRQGLSCVFRSMDPIEDSAWSAVAGGATFGAMCDGLLEWLPPDEIPPRAAQLLRTWLGDGLIAKLHTR